MIFPFPFSGWSSLCGALLQNLGRLPCCGGRIRGVEICPYRPAVFLRCGGSADHDGHPVPYAGFLRQLNNPCHLVHGGGQQGGAGDDVAVFGDSGLHKPFRRRVHPQVHHFNSAALKCQLDNILANSTLIAELNEDGAGADGFATLGYGLLGFHAVEYVLFRDGHARNIGDISENELIYNAAVAEDLAWQTVRLEAAWAGIDNVTSAKRKILEENELEPSLNYGEQMISAGLAGNSAYKTQIDAMIQILQGASDISDEVGNTKITDPVNSGNVLDVESWYSWNSIADFTDNLRSVRNAYYGSLDGSVNSSSLAAYLHKNNPTVDTELRSAIDNAIKTVAAMPAPFRNHLTKAETQAAVDACNKCMEALDAAIEVLQ